MHGSTNPIRPSARQSHEICQRIVPKQKLRQLAHAFECPYCGLQWARGSNEAKNRVGAMSHLHHCWQAKLYARGYLVGEKICGGNVALSVKEAPLPQVKRIRRIVRSRILVSFAPRIGKNGFPIADDVD